MKQENCPVCVPTGHRDGVFPFSATAATPTVSPLTAADASSILPTCDTEVSS